MELPLPSGTSTALNDEQAFLDTAIAQRDTVLTRIDTELTALAEVADGSAPDAAGAADVARARGLRHRRAELQSVGQALVFGRLDSVDGATRHIGRVGVPADGTDEEPVVLDWRAAAARPFYTATAMDPQGQAWRRHVRTDGRRVLRVDDEPLDGTAAPSDLVGGAALLAALDDRRTGRMSSAVATLQREQDDIVRAATRGPLVVQGGPGTGKTVVALHRVAYLLFADQRAAEQGVLVLGPSARFLDYIAQVLPALGETAVVSTTCAELVPDVRAQRGENRNVAEVKGRALWQDAVRGYVASLVPRPAALTVPVEGERYRIDAETIGAAIASAVSGRTYHRAREVFADELRELLVDAVATRRVELLAEMEEGFEDILGRLDATLARRDDRGVATAAGSVDVDGELSDDDLDELRGRLASDPVVSRAVDAFWPVRDAQHTTADLLHDPALLRRFASGLTDAEIATLQAEPAALAPSDVALVDSVAHELGEQRAPEHQGEFLAARAAATRDWAYGHVVVDEAQELSAMQWHMVARRCPQRSITAVGDMDQADSSHRHRTWSEAVGPVFGDRWEQAVLTVCYRTPREVLALAEQALAATGGPVAPVRAVRAATVAPSDVSVASSRLVDAVRDAVARLADRWSGGTVGVVASDAALARLPAALPGVEVVSAADAKGLEWDAVVVVDPAGIAAEPRGANRLYVALSRCTQELVRVVAAG